MAQINTTELDFDAIKSNLRDYFNRSDGPFKDYDFTGAGLNNILDINEKDFSFSDIFLKP